MLGLGLGSSLSRIRESRRYWLGLIEKEARAIFKRAETVSLSYSNRNGVHPLENMDTLNPRPGLRRWTAVNTATGDHGLFIEGISQDAPRRIW